MLKKIKRKIKKIKNKLKRMKSKYNVYYFNKINYKKWLLLPINQNSILLESTHGKTIDGNIFYILYELNKSKYKKFEVNVVIEKNILDKTIKKLEKYKINNVNIVFHSSEEYMKKLATSKFLINDTTFMPYFVKRKEQIYLNTWHGTPLKYLGKKVKEECHAIGNVQKNFFMSDFLLYPNEYTKNIMIEDYMINNISKKTKIILTGYPRNNIFFDKTRVKKIKHELGLEDEKIICYMPTWRGLTASKSNQKALYDMRYYLSKIDNMVEDNQKFYVNLHPYFKGKINFSSFKKIKPFPEEYETYDFLNIADVLVTDYSSVFFDFAITKKQIILFTYDEEDYLEDRGMYLKLEDLPFDRVKSVKQLFKEINNGKENEYNQFLSKFSRYDHKYTTRSLLNLILFNKNDNLKLESMPDNNKKNILIYVGNLAKNGLTISICNLLNTIDLSENNYYITFRSKSVKNYRDTVYLLSNKVNYIPITGVMNLNLSEKLIVKLYSKNKICFNKIKKVYDNNAILELKRLYGNIKFDSIIQFTGYDYKMILLFSYFKSNKVIYVHNDMQKEIEIRKNSRKKILSYAYNNYDKVALVTSDLIESTYNIALEKENFRIVNNIIDYEKIIRLSKQEIKFDNDTSSNIEIKRLKEILNSNSKKFITIGRFSPEKGQLRLIRSFERFYKDNPDSYLIIVGGHGILYQNILNEIEHLKCGENIILIKSISNPYSILKKCNYFILPSFYEGFGLVLVEADILGLPVVSTDITGPRNFMKEYGGTLVENSEDGIYEGLKLLMSNSVTKLKIDYEKYNKNAVNQFLNLLK